MNNFMLHIKTQIFWKNKLNFTKKTKSTRKPKHCVCVLLPEFCEDNPKFSPLILFTQIVRLYYQCILNQRPSSAQTIFNCIIERSNLFLLGKDNLTHTLLLCLSLYYLLLYLYCTYLCINSFDS